MGKRFGKGNDSTQDVSLSQFVPPKAPTRGNAKNDMSLWGGVVVGTSDFAPPVLKRPKASHRWKWIAGAGAGIGVVVAVIVLVSGGSSTPSKPAASATPAPVVVDAGAVADKKPDAAVVAVVDAGAPDAGAPTVAQVTGDVDAISGVAPIIKAAKKKPTGRKATAKKPVPKKKKR